jgi:tetratricopeptide (TPR) repeat protein
MLSTLRLGSRPGVVRAVTAWFVPGADPGRWLEALAASGLALTGTSLYLVPRSVESRHPAGVLVIPPKDHCLSQAAPGLACSSIAGRFFLPADAELVPPLSDAELQQLCPAPLLLFFHPSLGVSEFESGSCLRLSDLLERAAVAPEDWNCARPGPSLPAAFERIEVVRRSQDMFGAESREIGSEAGDPLPTAPDEPKEDAWSKAKRGLGQKGAKLLADFLGRLPHVGSGRNWLNRVEDWANQQAAKFAADLERLRNKELHRLLHMLEHDPEKGLRHALPLNDFPHRGRGPAGASLGTNDLNLNVHQLGGSGPADFWALTAELREQLTRRYRMLADRELRLKRFRRAAYIYAELLGDLPSAANALKQGRHFFEAALLYEERLNNPLAAAQCLAEGGLFQEAIERYEKLGRLLDVADLYERLDNRLAAQKTLRRLVAQTLAAGDSLQAAQLLEKRLQEPEEALQVLEDGWPNSRQAVQCFGARLDLLARLGRHNDSARSLSKLRRDPVAAAHYEPLAGILTHAAGHYPDQNVRQAALDVVQVFGSRVLSDPKLPPAHAQRWVGWLGRLAPQDRLLVRDGNRFLMRRRQWQLRQDQAKTKVVPHACLKSSLQPAAVRRFDLPKADWLQVRTAGLCFYAAGLKEDKLILLRGIWDTAEFQSIFWPCSKVAAKSGLGFELTTDSDRSTRVLLSVVGQPSFNEHTYPHLLFSPSCVAGTPQWLSPEMHPFSVFDSNLWSIHVASGRAVLSCYDLLGALLRTDDVTQDLLADANRTEATRLCLVTLAGRRALGLGNRLLAQQGHETTRIELPGQVTRLIPSLPHTRAGVVALLDHGAVAHWLGTEHLIELDRDERWIAGTWIPAGKLILMTADEGRIYDVDSRGVTAVRSFPWHGRPPIAVTSAGEPSFFAVFGAQGEVCIFHAGEK